MSWATSEVVGVLVFLLPGFVAAAVFYSLTSHAKPSGVERVLQALIFTIVGQAILRVAIAANLASIKRILETQDLEIVINLLVGVTIGLASAYLFNHDVLHGFFRLIRLTRETGYPSEWYSSFSENSSCYVVLHLKDGRRLYGWPREWPSDPERGHFEISEAEWLSEDGLRIGESNEIAALVLSVDDVSMVEFVSGNASEESEE